MAVILGIALNKRNMDIAAVLAMVVCCMVMTAVMVQLEPVLDFIRELQGKAGLDHEMMQMLLKAVGIGLVAEIAALICSDAGNVALGKGLQILASAVILGICLPMMRSLMDLMDTILGGL